MFSSKNDFFSFLQLLISNFILAINKQSSKFYLFILFMLTSDNPVWEININEKKLNSPGICQELLYLE